MFLLSILSRFVFSGGLFQPVVQLMVSGAALVYFLIVLSRRKQFYEIIAR